MNSALSARVVILEDGILVAEQFVTQQLKWSRDLEHSTLVLTELDGQSETPETINQLFKSKLSTYMIVPTVIFKLVVANKYLTLFYLKDARRRWLRVDCAEMTIF